MRGQPHGFTERSLKSQRARVARAATSAGSALPSSAAGRVLHGGRPSVRAGSRGTMAGRYRARGQNRERAEGQRDFGSERSSASLSASMTTPSSSIRTSGSTAAPPGTACSGRLKCHRRADAGNAGGAPAPLTSRESGESGRLREGHDLTGVQVGRLRTGPRMSMGRTPVSATQAWRSRWVTSCSNTWKSVPAIVDIGRRRDYGFSRSQKDRRAGQIRTARQQHVRYRWLQFAGRFGGGVPKPGLSQDGDGAGDRTGWPAVIRGRPAAEPVNACAVPSSEVSEQQPR